MLLQRLDALDALTRVQRFYLDKTGTVTDEHLQFAGLTRLGAAEPAQDDATLLAFAATMAGWSSHPMSKALVLAGADSGSAGAGLAPGWHGVQETPGQGLQAQDTEGRTWRLGRAAFAGGAADAGLGADLAGAGVADRAMEGAAASDSRAAAWLGRDGRLLARFDFDEALRPDACSTVAALRSQGLEVVLLSGDRPDRAQRMGHRLGVDAVIGGATPERKLAEVAAAQAQGLRVAMVGDGINDAPVLARADVSFAMGQGALVARAQADAVVVSSRLGDLVVARQIAGRTMRVIRQNLAWAAVYNGACIPLALVGWLPPWAAGLGMAASSLVVVGNALRLTR